MCDNDSLYGLHHETHYTNLKNILKEKYIKPYNKIKNYNSGFLNPKVSKLLLAYPGVYTNPITKNTITILENSYIKDNVKIILSKALLKTRACHINNANYSGVIYDKTYKDCYATLDKFLKDNSRRRYKTRLDVPEIIFHKSIHVKYIEKIICSSENIYKELIGAVPKQYIHLLTTHNLLHFAHSFKKYCVTRIDKTMPNYCFYHLDNIRGQKDLVFKKKFLYLVNNPETFVENCKKLSQNNKKNLYTLVEYAKKEIKKTKNFYKLFDDNTFSSILLENIIRLIKLHAT